MIKVELSEEFKSRFPELQILVMSCNVINTDSNESLWKKITEMENNIRLSVKMDEIKNMKPIQATRQAYKQLGKDPNRYRPSAESLRRRVLRGLNLYRIDTLVDLINLVSLKTGFSIGGFDVDKIVGDRLTLGVGEEGEIYHGIGRGVLNIAGLPVYRDLIGGVGTPTSDEERTKISKETDKLLMIINAYSGKEGLFESGKYAKDLLTQYVSGSDFEVQWITNTNRQDIIL